MRPEVRQASERLLRAEVSIAFVGPNKTAAHPWRGLQRERLTMDELAELVARLSRVDVGIAIVAGRASGNLEVIDFDTTALVPEWEIMVESLVPGLLARLVMVQTPRPGLHVYYRCAVIAGNQKLAQVEGPDGKPVTLMETRGIGGYVLIPPSPPACHPLHRPYTMVQGDLTHIPDVSPDERDVLLNAARTFNTYVNPTRIVANPKPRPVGVVGDRPGDLFAAAVSWDQLLTHYGWSKAGKHGEHLLWRRPGKAEGWSATSGLGETDLLYVFSTNASPFEADMLYSKFGAYAVLEHRGDLSRAASALAQMGYRRSRYTAIA
jgi:hypothetical protein